MKFKIIHISTKYMKFQGIIYICTTVYKLRIQISQKHFTLLFKLID